jgi:hypothetical protein
LRGTKIPYRVQLSEKISLLYCRFTIFKTLEQKVKKHRLDFTGDCDIAFFTFLFTVNVKFNGYFTLTFFYLAFVFICRLKHLSLFTVHAMNCLNLARKACGGEGGKEQLYLVPLPPLSTTVFDPLSTFF